MYIFLIPFFLTILGGIIGLKKIKNVEFLSGFSLGVMLASSFFSMINVGIDMSNSVFIPFLGVLFGYLFMNILKKSNKKMNKFIALSIILHNIPEGGIVGITLRNDFLNALNLSIAIGIQNIPEGYIITFNNSKLKGIFLCVLSSMVELLFSFIFYYININLAFLLCFCGSIMIYTCVIELSKNKNLHILYFYVGFLIMMFLDLFLSF